MTKPKGRVAKDCCLGQGWTKCVVPDKRLNVMPGTTVSRLFIQTFTSDARLGRADIVSTHRVGGTI